MQFATNDVYLDNIVLNVYTGPPVVSGISPTSGLISGATSVSINGSGFTGTTSVHFGTAAGTSVTVVNDALITVVSPAHAAGTVDVTVTTPAGTSAIVAADEFTYSPPPPAMGVIVPATGSLLGGTAMIIVGTGFTGVTSLTFGGTAATSFTILNDELIAAVTPAHAAGAVNVVMTGPGGTDTVTGGYTYVSNNDTRIDVSVSQGMDDVMARADYRYDGLDVGTFESGDYIVKKVLKIPDKNGTLYTYFVGVFVSSDGTFNPADDKMAISAYDYCLFASKQPLQDSERSLLPIAQQTAATNLGRTLSVKSPAHTFITGQRINGVTSKATGRIVEIAPTTGILTLYPAMGEFVDSEAINVGDTLYAYADGVSVDVQYGTYFGTVYPETWIIRVLGPASGLGCTGIVPYKIVPTDHSDPTLWDTDPVTSQTIAATPFQFPGKIAKTDAWRKVTTALRRIALVKPVVVDGVDVCGFYWVRQSQIDDATYGLDLPAAATVTAPCPDIDGGITLAQLGDDQAERVHLASTTLSGAPIDSVLPAEEPTGPYRELYDEPANVHTQTDLDNLCTDLYNVHSSRGATWTAIFIQRPDLQQYQKLTISGYGPRVPDGTYRIIKRNQMEGPAINKMQVWFVLDAAFSSKLRLGWRNMDTITQTQKIIDRNEAQKLPNEPGTVQAVNGDGTVTVQSDTGIISIAQDPSI
jgi:hypothetical protein